MAETINEKTFPGKYPHTEWLDLGQNGVLIECAILKRFPNSDTYFVSLESLDRVDKQRLLRILMNRNAGMYELWDLMDQVTLGNGVNALSYFNQLCKVRTASGQIMPFTTTRRGMGRIDIAQQQQQAPQPTESK